MIFCRACRSEVLAIDRFCRSCGEPTGLELEKPKHPARWFVVLALVVALLCVIGNFITDGAHDGERFVKNTMTYFAALEQSGAELSNAMLSGDHAPAAALEHIRHTVLAEQAVENNAYKRYLAERSRLGIPTGRQDVADDTDYVHRIFQKSMAEFLDFWSDYERSHIVNGSDDFKQSLREAVAVTDRLKAAGATPD